jgi:hypothetical protein
MTPRHPPRALSDLTTPTGRRDPPKAGRCGRCGRGVLNRRPRASRDARPPSVTIPPGPASGSRPPRPGSVRVHVRGDDLCHYHTWLCDETPNCQRARATPARRLPGPFRPALIAPRSPRPGRWPGGEAVPLRGDCRAPRPEAPCGAHSTGCDDPISTTAGSPGFDPRLDFCSGESASIPNRDGGSSFYAARRRGVRHPAGILP